MDHHTLNLVFSRVMTRDDGDGDDGDDDDGEDGDCNFGENDEDEDEDEDANQPELVLGDRSVLLKLGFSHI